MDAQVKGLRLDADQCISRLSGVDGSGVTLDNTGLKAFAPHYDASGCERLSIYRRDTDCVHAAKTDDPASTNGRISRSTGVEEGRGRNEKYE